LIDEGQNDFCVFTYLYILQLGTELVLVLFGI